MWWFLVFVFFFKAFPMDENKILSGEISMCEAHYFNVDNMELLSKQFGKKFKNIKILSQGLLL